VSSEGGTRPAWTREGRELVYLDARNRLTFVTVEATTTAFRSGTAVPLFATAYETPSSVAWRTYDVSADGLRFLVLAEATDGPEIARRPTFVVVENWFEELKAKLPTK
jgi:hypothetical protein